VVSPPPSLRARPSKCKWLTRAVLFLDKLIACAVVGQADVIVSGDEDLLVLQRVGGTPILTAAQFLEVLEQEP
jgi:hypothetical protein